VITDLNQISAILVDTVQTILFSHGDMNAMAIVSNLGMLAEDLTDLGHTEIANHVATAGKILFSYPMFINNHIVDAETIGNIIQEIMTANALIRSINQTR
jgi:hypothetical protein